MIDTRPRRPPAHTLFLLLLASLLTHTSAFIPPFPSSSSPSPFSHTRTCRQTHTHTHTRTATANPQEVEKQEEEKEGTTLTLGVFIEHTDRYGMMYHSNYLLFLSRALHTLIGRHTVLRLDNFRFKSSARLGHDVNVEVKNKEHPKGLSSDASPLVHTYSASIKESEEPHTMFITTDVTALGLSSSSSPLSSSSSSSSWAIPEQMQDVVDAPDKIMETQVWTDELDINGLLAPHAVLSMFERGRSDSLGGPDRLEELMADGYMFVVARIDGYRYNPSIPLREGDTLQVLGRFKQKGDSIVTCEQVVVHTQTHTHAHTQKQIVAQALVTLACISAEKGKMMKVPQKALECMNIGGGATAA